MINSNSFVVKNSQSKIFLSKNCGYFIITNYINYSKVEVLFLMTGSKVFCQMSQVRTGQVKDPYFPSVFNVGKIGIKYPVTFLDDFGNRKTCLEYTKWHNMIRRCYSNAYHVKQPTYKDCTVSENFKHYEYFYEWCQDQIGFGNENWHLDKDLLVKGNRIYSEDVCIFLPQELNTLILNNPLSRGNLPVGVNVCHNREVYVSSIGLYGNKRTIGYYNTPEEAFYAYKEAKEDHIKEQALKWKDEIDRRAFEALMNYQVDIDD